MDAGPSLLPLELRLRTLEAQVIGVPPAFSDPSGSSAASQQRSVFRRVKEVQDALERAGHESESVKRLINGYASYRPLLATYDHATISADTGAETDGLDGSTGSEGNRASRAVLTEADLLPDATKTTMLLEAAQDIRAAERSLREIELLRDRGVEGSGMLEDLLPLKQNLVLGIKEHKIRTIKLNEARRDVGALLRQYTDFTDTVSELFLDVHRRLEGMEEAVARAERRKKREEAERY